MEEAIKALSPWPLFQGVAIGLIVAAIGFWAVRKGLQDSRRRAGAEGPQLVRIDPESPALKVHPQLPMEEHHARWRAYEHLEATVKHLEKITELQAATVLAISRLADTVFNRSQP